MIPHPDDMEIDPHDRILVHDSDANRQHYAVEMGTPSTWPIKGYLPVRRPIPGELWPQFGVMMPERGAMVFLATLFEEGFFHTLGTCERIQYESFEAAKSDGWVID